MSNEIRGIAAGILSARKLRELEAAGLTVVSAALAAEHSDEITRISNEFRRGLREKDEEIQRMRRGIEYLYLDLVGGKVSSLPKSGLETKYGRLGGDGDAKLP